VLGISHGSSLDEAKAAYYSKVKQYHPDKVVGLDEEFRQLAERKTQELNAAFQEVRRSLGHCLLQAPSGGRRMAGEARKAGEAPRKRIGERRYTFARPFSVNSAAENGAFFFWLR
jgi:hypothetical protein